MFYIYKITRSDGLEYVGITNDITRRMWSHKKSARFACGITKTEVLDTTTDHSKAEILEERYIDEYNTFENGLNCTPNGKGNVSAERFSMYGLNHSDATKAKISQAHRGRPAPNKGIPHRQDTKDKLSLKRKGLYWGGSRKLTFNDAEVIREQFHQRSIDIPNSFIESIVKKSDRCKVGTTNIENLRAPNGKPLTWDICYIKFVAFQLNTSTTYVKKVIAGDLYGKEYKRSTSTNS